MYINGEGVLEDYVLAYAWYNLGASQGEELAKKNKNIVADKMTRSQIAEAQKLSKTLVKSNGFNRSTPTRSSQSEPSGPTHALVKEVQQLVTVLG